MKEIERCFTDKELRGMEIHPKDVGLVAVETGNKEKTLESIHKLAAYRSQAHDTYMDMASMLMSYIYDKQGIEALEEAMTKVVDVYFSPIIEAFRNFDFRQKVEFCAEILFVHGESLRIEEDDDKVTIWMNTCGGGQRQIEAGHYDNSCILRRIKADTITWGISDFPIYCIHAPIQDKLAIERLGYPTWVNYHCEKFGAESCAFAIYKDTKDIPEEVYTRVGMKKL